MNSTTTTTTPFEAAAPAAPAAPMWPGVISLALGTFSLVTSEFLPATLLTRMAQDLHVSEGAAGQAVTATAIMGAVAALVAGLLTRRFDRRAVVLWISALLTVSNVAVCVAPGLGTLLVARLVLGAALGAFWSMSAALTTRLVPPALVPKAMSIVLAGVSAATVCAAPAGALMGEWWGWRAVFAAAAGLGVLTLLAQLVWLPSMPPSAPVSLRSLAQGTRIPGVRLGLVMTLLVAAGHFAGFTYIRPFLERVPQFAGPELSAALLAFGIAGFLGNVAGAAAVGRSVVATVAAAPAGIALACVLLAAFGTWDPLSYAMIAFWGFAFGAVPIALQTWMTKVAPDHLESVGGVFVATFQVSITLGSIGGGLLLDHAGAYSPMLLAAAATGLGALVFWRRGAKVHALS
ncbi:MFS transporter [Ramlibacter sp.]|uniref:MFS transporter n=1 Tax=Ramlibacter sp. TaxID=1917967 RepID=UPI0017EA08A0|nr:MFS transporter [Ramlibacter sp.]MBA2676763.1 MFS transporter [Ramlibacter sp.]